ncbi:MAG: Rrf2 family transcriptional regulator [Candidatus Omnitrophica bacterium]|jgi:Rrf2 family protein|nr:Rrf2 family transcriptional regulator [Candidatus Omnitrophota bacterium]
MKLTLRSEYALLALIYLSRRNSEGYLPVKKIAEEKNIPAKFLEQILLTLKRARYLKSVKGQHGGYALAKAPDKIKLSEIIRLFDGALAPTESASKYFYEPTPIEKEKKLLKLFKGLRDYISNKLEGTTLADMC